MHLCIEFRKDEIVYSIFNVFCASFIGLQNRQFAKNTTRSFLNSPFLLSSRQTEFGLHTFVYSVCVLLISIYNFWTNTLKCNELVHSKIKNQNYKKIRRDCCLLCEFQYMYLNTYFQLKRNVLNLHVVQAIKIELWNVIWNF